MGRVRNFKKWFITLLVLVFLVTFSGGVQARVSFPDMPNDWSRDALIYAIENGILNGIDGKIVPYGKLTRSQVVAIMSRSLDLPESKNTHSFKDVKKSDWYYRDLQKVVDAGIMEGNGNEFKANDLISREEAFSVLNRAYKYQPKKDSLDFVDAGKISKWAYDSILALESNGIIKGSNNRINPKGKMTRAEFAQTIYSINKKKSIDEETSQEENEKEEVEPNVEDTENNRHFLYDDIYLALLNFEEEVSIDVSDYRIDYSKEDLNRDFMEDRLISRIILENPEIDYGYNGYRLRYSHIKGQVKTINIEFFYTWKHVDKDKFKDPKYRISREEMLANKRAVENEADRIVAELIDNSMSDFDKELAIHDYIVKNAEYDLENAHQGLRNNHTAYGVLIEGKGVCDSYAKAFYILGKKAGLDVLYVTGRATNSLGSQDHAWNMIKLDGDWYHVDTTWDDPLFPDGKEKPSDYICYKYFNLNDKELFKTHTIDSSLVSYPQARGRKYSYENTR